MKFTLSVLEEVRLEVLVIDRQVAVTLPHEGRLSSLHWLWLLKADATENLYPLLDCLAIDNLAGTIPRNLRKDGFAVRLLVRGEDQLFELGEALRPYRLLGGVRQEVAI